jgi:hypothetical protein
MKEGKTFEHEANCDMKPKRANPLGRTAGSKPTAPEKSTAWRAKSYQFKQAMKLARMVKHV